ncbi:putative integral membrane protein [Mycobacterium basiliense]|uniref:Putative integral membrane protein n=1 Tax=Mycobacterium basiliense TaxID=2094119 RepID=A0A447GKU3_9MYCO|nr:lipopolysaccharide assembly LapA domain-containing protein [Mycobacterium basiliense]VDM91122.1 putative integral membrane protein [Mycobacterium basiliense]
MSSNHSGSAGSSPQSHAKAPSSAPAPRAGRSSGEPPVKFTRAAALWSSLIAGFLILIILLIFIAQNTESTAFAFFGWHWSLPLGVAILLAAVGGGLLTVAVGTARILQLRREAKKSHAQALRATNPGR